MSAFSCLGLLGGVLASISWLEDSWASSDTAALWRRIAGRADEGSRSWSAENELGMEARGCHVHSPPSKDCADLGTQLCCPVAVVRAPQPRTESAQCPRGRLVLSGSRPCPRGSFCIAQEVDYLPFGLSLHWSSWMIEGIGVKLAPECETGHFADLALSGLEQHVHISCRWLLELYLQPELSLLSCIDMSRCV